MAKLTGKALADRAKALNIPGRSKMSADDLREAVKAYEIADAATKKADASPTVKRGDVGPVVSQGARLRMNGSGKVIGFRSSVDRVAFFANRKPATQRVIG